MGQSSEMMIEELNARYETDADFRREYDEQMALDAWLEDEYFKRELELEKFEDFFDDYRLAADGYEEIIEPEPVFIDDDIPF